MAGEQCTVTILKDRVHDVDLNDVGPNTDTLPADYSWSFTVATGAAPPYPASVHLTMGNPSNAGSDPSNYLMEKPEFALSYNRDLGRPNWVSWHLSDEWIGTLTRADTFRPDPQVPPDWYRVQSFDFSGSGFDRGHMTPNADRDKETSIPINQATFLMSNMVAQAPANNQGPWAALEAALRDIVAAGNELYIVSGPAGVGGTGSAFDQNGQPFVTTTLANGHVTVPASTWKVALVLPKADGDDLSRVSCSTRTIAVIMPNNQAINADWTTYLTTVDAVEALTGYDFFSNLPEPYQRCIEAGRNGSNPPLVKGDQTITFPQPADSVYGDQAFTVSATGGASGNPVTFAVSGASAGACSSSGPNGATITILAPGSCSITASQAGSLIYNAAADVVRAFTVGQAPLSVTAGSANREYGAANPAFTGTLVGVVNGDNITATYGTTATPASAVGTYAIAPVLNDPDGHLGNYVVSSVNGSLTIASATLTASADDKTREYGAPDPVFTGTLTGVVAGDDITASFASAAVPTSPPGPYAITPALSDPLGRLGNYNVTTHNGVLTITDTTPPSLTLPANITGQALSPAGLVVSYVATASDLLDGAVGVTCAPISGAVFAVGATTVNCAASDAHGNTAQGSFTVTVAGDTAAPVIQSVTPSVTSLWPPNKSMIPVSISVHVSDNLDAAPACHVSSVTSSEGSSADWQITGPLTVSLRADRNGNGNGRTYTITVRCTDAFGNTASASTGVVVPHDQRK